MFENSTTPADQGAPHFAAHWGIATLFSGPEAGMRAARASMRLISLVAELPCDWGASVGWTASGNGVASVWLSARGLSDADVTWLGESTASWARLEDCPAADLNCEDSDAWEVVATPTRHALPASFPVPPACGLRARPLAHAGALAALLPQLLVPASLVHVPVPVQV